MEAGKSSSAGGKAVSRSSALISERGFVSLCEQFLIGHFAVVVYRGQPLPGQKPQSPHFCRITGAQQPVG
jgi:hypothetical protein